ncbi:hypothetical protein Asppvi_003935 [Aspergillus pseudoviridinutans]|uniref:Uncharacterized protein n=1 Tax=Aspergillus pseudoviridinutans TaxID=1517512 RepID=A0A9P3B991_9EURO|nr:uncharacterized protein Asppvi_003935 [Aspergillus pseudoviridinutans]GIJ85080.1 hypothetical protein Asppvi_003935 [Aspergillus pseudoviridinutans]
MDEGNKGEEVLRMAEAVLVHPQPAIVRLGAFERFDNATDCVRPGSRRSSESLKAEVNPGVARAVELEEVVDMPDMALEFGGDGSIVILKSGGIDGTALEKPNMLKCLNFRDLFLYQNNPNTMHHRQPTPKNTSPTMLFVVK